MSTPKTRHARGLWAEHIASLYLQAKNYCVLERRARTPLGEVDIVAKKGGTLVLVEVKYRQHRDAALQSITPRQQERLRRAAGFLAPRYPRLTTVRWDIIALAPWAWPRHIINAWDGV